MSPCPLRVYVITEEDPFYLPEFFREFLPALPRDRFDILGIDITPPLNQTSRRALARKLYGFYGGRDFARLLGRYAVARALDLTAPRGMWCGTIDRLAGCHGIACDVVKNVNAPAYVDHLRRPTPADRAPPRRSSSRSSSRCRGWRPSMCTPARCRGIAE